jgi:cobalamin synthase
MVYMPLVGFGLGVAMALVDQALEAFVGHFARSAMVIALVLVATAGLHPVGVARTLAAFRRRQPEPSAAEIGPGNWLIATAVIGLELVCLASIVSAPARARAIVLAMMLSRWAIVPIGYGLRPLDSSGLGLPYEGGIKFREFAIGSVVGLGLAMGLYDIVALAAIVALALTILLLRLLFSRGLGGASGYALAAGAAICELVVLAVLAALRI